jgi:fructose-1,6-bisphosphatase II / sedoheptulose-1,7-bisphosphatase
MRTQSALEKSTLRKSLESDLSLEFLRVVEQAAIASAHTMGQGDRRLSDQAAVEAMRKELDTVPIDGTVVIGEGERDEAPMLYGGLLHAPDIYMQKLVVGPSAKHLVDLDAPVRENLRAIARSLGRQVDELTVVVLDRPRHEQLIADIRATGARIRLIGDGDLSAGIAAAVSGSGVHAVMGTGGAPEGVLTAAAMRCLNGEIFARLVVSKPEHEERCRAMGITDTKRVFKSEDLASGRDIIFAATGVTDGALMRGVRFFGDGIRTSSLIMQTSPHRIRFIDSIQVYPGPAVKIRF